MSTAGVDMTREAMDARQERVVELTRCGHSASAISVIVGISPRSVTRTRRRAGLTADYRRPPGPSEDQLLAGKHMLTDGASYAELSRSIGFDAATWRKHLPGYSWSHAEIGRHGKAMLELGRKAGVSR